MVKGYGSLQRIWAVYYEMYQEKNNHVRYGKRLFDIYHMDTVQMHELINMIKSNKVSDEYIGILNAVIYAHKYTFVFRIFFNSYPMLTKKEFEKILNIHKTQKEILDTPLDELTKRIENVPSQYYEDASDLLNELKKKYAPYGLCDSCCGILEPIWKIEKEEKHIYGGSFYTGRVRQVCEQFRCSSCDATKNIKPIYQEWEKQVN